MKQNGIMEADGLKLNMKIKKAYILKLILMALVLSSAIALFFLKDSIDILNIFTDKELLKKKIESFGIIAPFAYMLIQTSQVFIAPVPGEITGIAGGYMFGVWKGFFYSTIALTFGSIINFTAARYAGKEVVRKIIPEKYWKKFDAFFEKEGKLFILAFFIFPGFPKDYFCLFLGITNLDFRLFILFSCLGRIPGTFLLSLQGSLFYEGSYALTIFLAVIIGSISFLIVFFRKKLYSCLEKNTR